jgi:hypothetical protein
VDNRRLQSNRWCHFSIFLSPQSFYTERVVGGSSSLTHIHVETIRTNFIRSVVFQTGLASTMVYNSGKILRGDIFPLSINHFLDSSSNDLSPSTEFPKRTYRYVHTCM